MSGVASKTKKKSRSFKGRTDELSQMRLKIANLHTCPPPASPSACLPPGPPILLTHASLRRLLPSLPSLTPFPPVLLCSSAPSCTPVLPLLQSHAAYAKQRGSPTLTRVSSAAQCGRGSQASDRYKHGGTMIVTGARGSGKTVLVKELDSLCKEVGARLRSACMRLPPTYLRGWALLGTPFYPSHFVRCMADLASKSALETAKAKARGPTGGSDRARQQQQGGDPGQQGAIRWPAGARRSALHEAELFCLGAIRLARRSQRSDEFLRALGVGAGGRSACWGL